MVKRTRLSVTFYVYCLFCFWIRIVVCRSSFCDGPISGPRWPKSVCKHDLQTQNTRNHLSETTDHRTYYFMLQLFFETQVPLKAFRSPLGQSDNMKYSGLNPWKWSRNVCIVSVLLQSLCGRYPLKTYSFWPCACVPNCLSCLVTSLVVTIQKYCQYSRYCGLNILVIKT